MSLALISPQTGIWEDPLNSPVSLERTGESVRSEPGQEPHHLAEYRLMPITYSHHNKVTRLMKILAKQFAGEVARYAAMLKGTEMTRRGSFRTMSGMNLGEKKREQNSAPKPTGAA
jgi:hypothetical protein